MLWVAHYSPPDDAGAAAVCLHLDQSAGIAGLSAVLPKGWIAEGVTQEAAVLAAGTGSAVSHGSRELPAARLVEPILTDDEVLALPDDEFFAEVARGFERLRRDPEAWQDYNEIAEAFARKALASKRD